MLSLLALLQSIGPHTISDGSPRNVLRKRRPVCVWAVTLHVLGLIIIIRVARVRRHALGRVRKGRDGAGEEVGQKEQDQGGEEQGEDLGAWGVGR